MKLEIFTPDKNLFQGEASAVVIPGLEGRIGILDHHAPMIASLKKGMVKVTQADNHGETFEVNGGVAEVNDSRVIILAD